MHDGYVSKSAEGDVVEPDAIDRIIGVKLFNRVRSAGVGNKVPLADGDVVRSRVDVSTNVLAPTGEVGDGAEAPRRISVSDGSSPLV